MVSRRGTEVFMDQRPERYDVGIVSIFAETTRVISRHRRSRAVMKTFYERVS
jgi:hypothetical protein